MGVLGVAAVDDVKEGLLDLFGEGAAAARADLDAVHLADGRDFGGRAGEEDFIGDVQLVARDALLHHFQAQVLADVHHGVARDAVERAGRQVGRVDHAVLDDEDVLARAFGDEARGVQQDGLVVAVVQRLGVGQDGVGVVAHRLGLAHGDVHMVAREAGDLHADAALHAFLAQVGAPGPGSDHQVDGVALGGDAQLAVADPGQRAQVARFQAVGAHDLDLGLVHRFLGERDLHAQDLGAVEQAPGVVFQAEDGRPLLGLVGPHALECAAAVVQRVGQHVDLGIAPVHQLAIHPDLAVTVGHRGNNGAHRNILGGIERNTNPLF